MKRYQCICNVWRDGKVAFKGGKIYTATEEDFRGLADWQEMVDEQGETHIVTDSLLTNFRELEPAEDLPIPDAYHDPEAEEYTLLQPDTGTLKGFAWGCAILFALFAAGMYIITLIERP